MGGQTRKRVARTTEVRFGVKAIILSAGQGRRLLPLTANVPKCLLPVAGRTVLDWQLRALAEAGVYRATVVVGFGASMVEAEIAERGGAGMQVETLLNPHYDRSDNLVSCWAARSEMQDDFLLLNGDTLFQPAVVSRLLRSQRSPVAMGLARKTSYDADDMKVSGHNGNVLRVGKDLQADTVTGEAIGVSLFRDDGPRLFERALDRILHEPDAHRRWYLSAVNLLAEGGFVRGVPVGGMGWTEIDTPQDLARAQSLVARWHDVRPRAPLSITAEDADAPVPIEARSRD
jgi:choline kinase